VRSWTGMSPPGRKASDQGTARPVATALTLRCSGRGGPTVGAGLAADARGEAAAREVGRGELQAASSSDAASARAAHFTATMLVAARPEISGPRGAVDGGDGLGLGHARGERLRRRPLDVVGDPPV